MRDEFSNRETTGESIRDVINPALSDDRKQKFQLDMLDKVFESWAEDLPFILQDNLRNLFNHLSDRDTEEQQNAKLIVLLTKGQYSPQMDFKIPMAGLLYTDFSPQDICSLPGYIKLHQAALEHDVALRLTGLTGEEVRATRGHQPAFLTIDAGKSYDQGASENSALTPQLPEPTEAPETPKGFDRSPKTFDFGS